MLTSARPLRWACIALLAAALHVAIFRAVIFHTPSVRSSPTIDASPFCITMTGEDERGEPGIRVRSSEQVAARESERAAAARGETQARVSLNVTGSQLRGLREYAALPSLSATPAAAAGDQPWPEIETPPEAARNAIATGVHDEPLDAGPVAGPFNPKGVTVGRVVVRERDLFRGPDASSALVNSPLLLRGKPYFPKACREGLCRGHPCEGTSEWRVFVAAGEARPRVDCIRQMECALQTASIKTYFENSTYPAAGKDTTYEFSIPMLIAAEDGQGSQTQ